MNGSDRGHGLSIGELDRIPWRRLARVCTDARVPAHLRKVAENRLSLRLERLALGEQVALARIAPRAVLPDLAGLGKALVFAAVLGNPRLTFKDLIQILRDRDLPPELLRLVGEHHRWGEPAPVRTLLVAHPATPVHTALKVLASLPREDVRRLLEEGSLPPVVAIQAGRLQGGKTE